MAVSLIATLVSYSQFTELNTAGTLKSCVGVVAFYLDIVGVIYGVLR